MSLEGQFRLKTPRYACLFQHDQQVADWVWKTFNLFPYSANMAIGIIDTKDNNKIVGCALYHWWNGSNIELSYFGPKTITLGIVRKLASVAFNYFKVERVTLRISHTDKVLISGAIKLGFEEEGIERHFYAKDKHCVRMAIFRDGLAKLAGHEVL